ncbi:MAG: protein tyrosine phosphatase [Polyangiaceae bacterium]|nr:protein tyrosine phosphatase [Polyangiaceae bacterium]
MRGFVDLHCHWVAGIDDGPRSPGDGLEMLRRLKQVGFDDVVATPHMRPGLFDNDRPKIEQAFLAMGPVLSQSGAGALPRVHLSSEHFFDDVVFGRLLRGEALPYTGGAVLVEFGSAFPVLAEHRFFDLRSRGLAPVLAHPERYEAVWRDDACLDPLLDSGAHLLLDLCSLVGKYGRAPERAATKLLEEDAYEAACSDAHRPEDVELVARAVDRLTALVGRADATRLLAEGPRALLTGGSKGPEHESPGEQRATKERHGTKQ